MDSNVRKKLANLYGEHFLRDEDRFKKMEIKDIPVMFDVNGGIVCIPRKGEVFNVGFVAKRGKGKTLMANGFLGRLFWEDNNIVVMNDSLEETYEWTKPQNNPEWINQLEYIGQVPCPSPLIFIFQNSTTLNLSDVPKDINYVKVTLPFSELIDNLEVYLDVGKSATYLRPLKEQLLDCTSPDEVMEVLQEIKPKNSGYKLMTLFDNIFKEEILNITNQEIPDTLAIDGYEDNPFSVILKAGCIASFITSDLYTRKYHPQIFAYYINLLYQNQFSREFQGQRLFLFFDEITKICSTEEENPARKALEQIPTRGRQMRIGLIYCTQNYEKIPRMIQSNTDYIFAFRHSSSKEVKEIAKDFDVPEWVEKELLNLKKFEVIGLTSDKFIIYKNGETIETSEPVRGYLIPPLCRHRRAE